MKCQIVVLVAAIIAGALLVEGGKGMKDMKCKDEPIKSELMWKGMKECTAKLYPDAGKSDDKESKKKMWKELKGNTCFEVCKMQEQGILTSDGDYDSAGVETLIKEAIPASAQADMKQGFEDCKDKIGDKATRMENKCAGYKEFAKCKKIAFFKACGLEEKMKEMKKKWAEKSKAGDGQGEDMDM